MKRCRYCAEEIQDLAILCRFCGREQDEPNPVNERKSFAIYAGAGFAIFCVALAVAAAATHPATMRRWAHAVANSFAAAPDTSKQVAAAFVPPPPPPPPPPPLVQPIVSEEFRHFEPNTYVWWTFTLDDTRPCRLQGRISVTEGGSHDIDVLLLDRDGFANFQNGHDYSAYLSQQRTSAVTLDLPVASFKEYFLVVSNRFSIFTGKTVAFENIHAICDSSL